MNNPFNTVVQILTSASKDLRELALLTDLPIRDFYRGADLRGLNLSGQDLTGLNFQKADLRGADLFNIIYDPGAFNGSFIDEDLKSLIDEYDFFIDEIEENVVSRMSVMYRFRPGLIDDLLSNAGVSYREFADEANVSTATLRRVRSGRAVANESIFGVIRATTSILIKGKSASHNINNALGRALQPTINVGYYDIYGAWISVNKEEFPKFVWMLNEVYAIRYGKDWRSRQKSYECNMKPPSIEWAYNFYSMFDDPPYLDLGEDVYE